MKKLLGISVIAALAVLPMAGYAAVTDADPGATVTENAQMATNSPKYGLAQAHGTDGNLATAGYVKGAYNAAIKAVNKLSDDTDTKVGTLSNLSTTTKTNLVAAINEVASAASGDSQAIETKLGAGASGYDINAASLQVQGVDAVTVSGEQTLTDKIIDADDNTIRDLTTGNLKSGTLVQSTSAQGGTGIAAASSASDTKLVSEKAVADAIEALETSAGNDMGDLDDLTTTADSSLVAAINEVVDSVSDLATDVETNYATKAGVLATINASTVNAMAAWGDTQPTPIAVVAPNTYQTGAGNGGNNGGNNGGSEEPSGGNEEP